jgi:hypothetical protein
MSFEEQEYYIDSLNSKGLNVDYHLINLSEEIDFGYFWSGPRAGQSRSLRFEYIPAKYYLIKNEGKYCSIIEDRGYQDLQVFTKPEFRHRNIVYNAMQKTIFAHLKQSRKVQQVTTTQDNLEAKKLIKKLGFKLIETINGKLIYRKSFQKIVAIEFPNAIIEKIKLKEYQWTISNCFEMIELISKHLELAGNHETLSESLKQILKYRSRIFSDFDYEIYSPNEL